MTVHLPSPARAPVPVWAPPAGSPYQHEHDQWVLLGQTIARLGVPCPARTTGQTAGVWAEATKRTRSQWEVQGWLPRRVAPCPDALRSAVWVVASGVAVADLHAVGVALQRLRGRTPAPMTTAHTLLDAAEAPFGQFTVRDTVGWLLAADACGDNAIGRAGRRADQWAQGGFPDGWVFAAAGMTMDEARVMTREEAGFLAAMRGAVLPVE